jgi:hypothetical protein
VNESGVSPADREGERRYNSYSFLTSALDGVVSVTPWQHFTPGKEFPVTSWQEVRWASELVWTQRLEKESFASAGDLTPVAQSVVRQKKLLIFINDAKFKHTYQAYCRHFVRPLLSHLDDIKKRQSLKII